MISRRLLIQFASSVALGHVAQTTWSDESQAKARRLVFIHGRGQQGLDPKKLQTDWMTALNRGGAACHRSVPGSVKVCFPFYGNQLGDFEKASSIPLTSEATARGDVNDQFLVFQGEFIEELRQKAGVTDAQIDAEYGNDPEARGPLNWKWVQAILRAVDKHGGGMNQKALELFTRDVYLYCTLPGVRDAINHTVAAVLTEEPTVVVAHSLGTIVAYSILTTDSRMLKVPLLVTLGCPLGVRAVRDQFRPLHSPDPVGSWYNAFDTRDVVALYPLDPTNFPVNPPIMNNNAVKNHTDNRHGIDGYLDDKAVATQILDALAQ
jgi:hypothetical protein